MRNYVGALFVVVLSLGLLAGTYGGQSDLGASSAAKDQQPRGGTHMEIERKVVFHLDSDEEARLKLALENMKNLFKVSPPQNCRVVMVANGKAVNLFRKDKAGKHAADMQELHQSGVRFTACRNALAKNKITKNDLLDIIQVVPAGIVELIDLQAQGFAYIKP